MCASSLRTEETRRTESLGRGGGAAIPTFNVPPRAQLPQGARAWRTFFAMAQRRFEPSGGRLDARLTRLIATRGAAWSAYAQQVAGPRAREAVEAAFGGAHEELASQPDGVEVD